eukprot:14581886-Ditylum_brightwellii.AAC.1
MDERRLYYHEEKTKTRFDPLFINTNNTSIRCGKNGLSRNECVFEGGSHHIVIFGKPRNVRIQGVTMKRSLRNSVVAAASECADVTFFDCVWQCNLGEGAILITAPPRRQRNSNTHLSGAPEMISAQTDDLYVDDEFFAKFDTDEELFDDVFDDTFWDDAYNGDEYDDAFNDDGGLYGNALHENDDFYSLLDVDSLFPPTDDPTIPFESIPDDIFKISGQSLTNEPSASPTLCSGGELKSVLGCNPQRDAMTVNVESCTFSVRQ